MPLCLMNQVNKIYLLDHGKIRADIGWFLPTPMTVEEMTNPKPRNWVDVSVMSAVIEHKDGIILFDTGISEKSKTKWPNMALSVFPIVSFSDENKIENQLKSIGLKPEDIHFIVFSHLHLDHTGSLEIFKSSKPGIIVHEKELKFALLNAWLNKPVPYVYDDLELLRNMNIMPITGEYFELLPGIELFLFGGHTPGSIVVKVRTKNENNYVFTGDFLHVPEELDYESKGWLLGDAEEYFLNMKKLKAMMKVPRTSVIISHDPKLWDKYPKAPKSLD
ncbi:N-acyl homoserine lactonase family protein [Sulfolobus sp. A20-N-F6]|nr:N-acyl homoserine lactonase family protein [Sulfolobus sp. A20-N-F8]TRM74980.1 N-acyl homoserine lactonase family protein [Sulfolobus sp. E5]TRM80165.1 N-acyl homoserine lactonase family protein [Sulfolobus sp. A20-N-F6]TRM86254.1 N-acyl homoserine lactonase family protein [Sulfolobus sp. C3]TRM98143.1 N-acyl homoserine lactonase family protein [Sulfolobus sp. B1]TRN03964.1 N-acyl homoserine lactonase family protein [Sulfolobus sp. E1]